VWDFLVAADEPWEPGPWTVSIEPRTRGAGVGEGYPSREVGRGYPAPAPTPRKGYSADVSRLREVRLLRERVPSSAKDSLNRDGHELAPAVELRFAASFVLQPIAILPTGINSSRKVGAPNPSSSVPV
jgi:hypothetical protein